MFLISSELILDLKTTFEVISPIILMYAAIRALWQISLIREQNIITRDSIAVQELRNFSKLIEDFDSLASMIKEKDSHLRAIEMKSFTLDESSGNEFKGSLANWHKFYDSNKKDYILAVALSNKLEVVATALNKGVANLETIEDSIRNTFCQFVEINAYVYVRNRNNAISLYKNTIDLYQRFKPKVKTMEEQKKAIEKQVSDLLENNKL